MPTPRRGCILLPLTKKFLTLKIPSISANKRFKIRLLFLQHAFPLSPNFSFSAFQLFSTPIFFLSHNQKPKQSTNNMKKIILGTIIGIALSMGGILIAMSGGEEFRSTQLKYGLMDGTGIIASDRFIILFDYVPGTYPSGSSMVTISGRHGTLPAPWREYSSGWGGAKGINSLHTYNPDKGEALLFYFGKLVLIEDSGRILRVQDGRFPLGDSVLVVSVDSTGYCKTLTDEEAQQIYASLDPWFKDESMSTRPIQ